MEVNSFWTDGALTTLERLCLTSFVRSGIRYNLYVYEEPAGVPSGVQLRDASAIVPRDRLFRYEAGTFNLGSVAGFSNLFRYSLIHAIGGWWVDTDICYLENFDNGAEEIYFRAPTVEGELPVASSFFKAPADSSVLARCLEVFATKDVRKIVHGETGPTMLTQAVIHAGREHLIQPGDLVFPIPWWEFERFFAHDGEEVADWRAVHFWTSLMRDAGVDQNATFPENSVFEKLKRRYL